jgi:glutamate dehydrogenase/leucine dehydrogenase
MIADMKQQTNKGEFLAELLVLKDRFETLKPELEVTVRDPALGVEGHIVVWNTAICKGGPLEFCGKGGTRITPNLSRDEVKMLARTMALKNAAAGLPMGGAKSGLCADPKVKNFETAYRRFVKLCQPFLHENGGAFGGFGFDIGGAPEHALWACDELKSLRCFTGKPLDMGGTDYDREGIAGFGVAVAGKTLIECLGEKHEGKTFAVQGLGAMGAAVLRYFSEYGASLRALGDPKYGGSWRFENGISKDLWQALAFQDVEKAKALLAIEGKNISATAEEVLYEEVDILFPCAVQNVITEKNVGKIRARMIAEGANQPVTEGAYVYLQEKGVHLVPDFLANSGGIIAAFVELTSKVSAEENARTRAKVDEAKNMTIEKITQNVKDMMALVQRYNIEPVHAGMYLALSRIFGT